LKSPRSLQLRHTLTCYIEPLASSQGPTSSHGPIVSKITGSCPLVVAASVLVIYNSRMTDTKDAGLVPPEIQYKGPVLKNRLSWALGFFIFFSGATVIFFGIQAALERIHFRQDFQELLYHNRVITLSLKLLSDAKDIETGQRGFLLTDDRSYLEPYQNSRRSVL
ncbi:membrane protein containing CHASE3 domain protein, partial [mine drainage metagenome]